MELIPNVPGEKHRTGENYRMYKLLTTYSSLNHDQYVIVDNILVVLAKQVKNQYTINIMDCTVKRMSID